MNQQITLKYIPGEGTFATPPGGTPIRLGDFADQIERHLLDLPDGDYYLRIMPASAVASAAAAALGSITSPAKAKASRENGKRGGRPRKKKAE